MTLYVPAWIRILNVVTRYKASRLSRVLKMSYSTMHKLVNEMESKGLIIKHKSERGLITIELTDKGARVKRACDFIVFEVIK